MDRRRTYGFTLLELMVAIAIVAVIGVIALTGLSMAIRQQEFSESQFERWREVQFAMRMIVQDLSQVHPRVVRDETGGSFEPSFDAGPLSQFALEFSRGGWSNPAGFPRGTVLRVAYDIEGDTLVRFYWPVADRTQSTPPARFELLTGIVSMNVVFIGSDGTEYSEWGSNGRLTDRPRAVRFTLELEDYGEIWRLIEVGS
ncbi:MAG: type II secretion system minor pseudopilin GspJ [Gammaproteobacteria bacterium]